MLNNIKTTTTTFFNFKSVKNRERERERECSYAINCLDEFVVPLIAGDKVTRRCPQTTIFEERRSSGTAAESKRGPSAYQPYLYFQIIHVLFLELS